jgi:NADPH:quinone reductase-like Zn-dependent oxidoreductase
MAASNFLDAKGTWAEYVAVNKKDVVPCPTHLSLAEAAALPLAGLTAFRYG